MDAAIGLAGRFVTYVINPTILVVFTAGFLWFLWGLVVFIFKLDEGGERKEGKDHMLWGLVGMLVMVSVYGILAIINNTFGLGVDLNRGTYSPDMNRVNQIIQPGNLGG